LLVGVELDRTALGAPRVLRLDALGLGLLLGRPALGQDALLLAAVVTLGWSVATGHRVLLQLQLVQMLEGVALGLGHVLALVPRYMLVERLPIQAFVDEAIDTPAGQYFQLAVQYVL